MRLVPKLGERNVLTISSIYAAATFFDKLGSGLGADVALPLVGWLGFDPEAATSEVGAWALIVVSAGAPITGFSVAIIAARFVNTEGSRRTAE